VTCLSAFPFLDDNALSVKNNVKSLQHQQFFGMIFCTSLADDVCPQWQPVRQDFTPSFYCEYGRFTLHSPFVCACVFSFSALNASLKI